MPAIIFITIARSETVRAIGPPTSCVFDIGTNPDLLVNPNVGRSPTRLLLADGKRIEFPVSLPIPTTAKFAAIAAAVPPLDPPGLRSKSYGFKVCPPKELTVEMPKDNSCKLAFARIIAPAFLRRLVKKASFGGIESLKITDP